MPTNEDRIIRYWYESYTPDGRMWCGSSNPDEVAEKSGSDCTFARFVWREYVTKEPWEPKKG